MPVSVNPRETGSSGTRGEVSLTRSVAYGASQKAWVGCWARFAKADTLSVTGGNYPVYIRNLAAGDAASIETGVNSSGPWFQLGARSDYSTTDARWVISSGLNDLFPLHVSTIANLWTLCAFASSGSTARTIDDFVMSDAGRRLVRLRQGSLITGAGTERTKGVVYVGSHPNVTRSDSKSVHSAFVIGPGTTNYTRNVLSHLARDPYNVYSLPRAHRIFFTGHGLNNHYSHGDEQLQAATVQGSVRYDAPADRRRRVSMSRCRRAFGDGGGLVIAGTARLAMGLVDRATGGKRMATEARASLGVADRSAGVHVADADATVVVGAPARSSGVHVAAGDSTIPVGAPARSAGAHVAGGTGRGSTGVTTHGQGVHVGAGAARTSWGARLTGAVATVRSAIARAVLGVIGRGTGEQPGQVSPNPQHATYVERSSATFTEQASATFTERTESTYTEHA